MNLRVLAITNMYPTGDRPWFGTFVEQQVRGLESLGIEVKVVFIDRQKEGPLAYYRAAQRIHEAESAFDPHLLHAMYGGVMAERIVSRHHSRPVVVTFHGSDLLGENLSGVLRKFASLYGVHCSRAAARKADGVVAVARHLEQALPDDVDRRRVRVIPCGIDPEQFRRLDRGECRRRLGWDPAGLHVLFPANGGDPVKRPWLAQAAVQQYVKRGGKAVLHLLSGIPYRDVPVWINASDVVLLTSLHEGSPTVVKEALACDTPVVSVNVGDVADRIAGVAGCHLASVDPDDLAAKLCLVAEGSRRIDGAEAIKNISTTAIAQRLLIFYEDILGLPLRRPAAPKSRKRS